MARVLVTGGAGFIGREVCRALLAEGHAVDVCDLESAISDNFRLMDKRFGYIYPRPLSELTAEILQAYECVVHCAAISDTRFDDTRALWKVNYEDTVRLAALSPRRFVFVSSAGVYGDLQCDPMTDDFDPQTVYAMTKLAAERALLDIYAEHTSLLMIVRPFNVFGPGEMTKEEHTRSLVYRMCDALVDDTQFTYHSPDASRDFIHVDDVADMITCFVNNWPTPSSNPRRVLNLGTGTSTSVRQLMAMVGAHSHPLGSFGFKLSSNPHHGSYQSVTRALFTDDGPHLDDDGGYMRWRVPQLINVLRDACRT